MAIRYRAALGVALVVSVTSSAPAIEKKQRGSKTVREVQTVLESQVEAWNRRDLEGFMKGYWRSSALTFYSGATKLSGWQATIERYRQRYQSEGREMGHLDFSDLQIEIVGPRGAFVRGRWHLKMSGGETGGLFTLVLRRFEEGWRIVHDHTSSA